ncbi:MAG TPA: helicase-associated domain-containing protein, partial [Actinomycetota bacterium]|nr:helicase-associated domain-containing protein [Actinomycetota bacterium]
VEVSLAEWLEGLERRDLETLLRRRPEARSLFSAKRCDLRALAEAISRPEAVMAAAESLDGFLLNLLHAALLLNPDASAPSLSALAPGVDPEELAAGAQELSRWGLAFVVPNLVGPQGNGSAAVPRATSDGSRAAIRGVLGAGRSGNWSLYVPACVANVVARPRGMGPPVRRALAAHSPALLAGIAANLGLTASGASKGLGWVAEIAAALLDPDRVAGLLADAPGGSRQIVGMAREVGGVLRCDELVRGGLIRWDQPHWTGQGAAASPLEWLESRGLLVTPSGTTHDGTSVAVPAEVEIALRGGRMFESWPPAQPPRVAAGWASGPRARTVAAALAAQPVGDPSKSVADFEALLDLWTQMESPSLQKGGLGVRELRRAAKAINLPEGYVAFLYALAVESGLLAHDDRRRVVPSPAAAAWAAKPPALRWAGLFETYLSGMLWVETRGGLVDIDKVEHRAYLVRLRRSLLSELAALPTGATTDVNRLGRWLMWRHPLLIHCEDCARTLTSQVAQALGWLGTLAAPPLMSLLEPARSAVAGSGWTDQVGPATAAFAPAVSEITVGADLSIIVPGPPVPALGAALARFADLQASSPARIYRLSEASVRRALDAGMKGSEITDVLVAHAPGGLPQNVAYLIDDVANRHGHLVLGHAGLFVRSDDPALLAGVIADRRLTSFGPRLLAPTVALLDDDDPAKALTALRSAGYLPVAEAGGAALTASKAPAVPILLRSARSGPAGTARADLAPDEAEALAEALVQGSRGPAAAAREGPGPAMTQPRAAAVAMAGATGRVPAGDEPGGPACTNPEDVCRLLEWAATEKTVVEIAYVTSRGRTSMRKVEPYAVLGSRLYATCHLTGTELTIQLARVASARVTGDPVDVEYDEDEDLILLLKPLPSR